MSVVSTDRTGAEASTPPESASQLAVGPARPAKRPVAAPAAGSGGVLLALAVIALGVTGFQHAAVKAGWIHGASWLDWLIGKAEVLRPADWMIWAGVAAVVVGLWLLFLALKPRRATHLAVGDGGVWIRPGDLARLAVDTARGHSEVSSATGKAKRRKVTVAATALTPDTTALGTTLTTAIATRLRPVTPAPRVRVRITSEEN